MNLKDAKLESLSNAELDYLAAEARGFPGVGYYGPTKPSGGHTDERRYDTKAEALEQHVIHWPGPPEHPGCACGADMDEDDMPLCYWKEGWGPLVCPCPTDSCADTGLGETTFEQWFFEQQPKFTLQVLANWINGKMTYSVEISHDTHDFPDAYFEGEQESRLRTLAVLHTLKGLEILAKCGD